MLSNALYYKRYTGVDRLPALLVPEDYYMDPLELNAIENRTKRLTPSKTSRMLKFVNTAGISTLDDPRSDTNVLSRDNKALITEIRSLWEERDDLRAAVQALTTATNGKTPVPLDEEPSSDPEPSPTDPLEKRLL